jgi:hypothetical protein
MFRERSREQVSLVTVSCPSPRTVAPPPCFTTGYKRLTEGGREAFLMGAFDWLALMLTLSGVSPPEQLSALRTLYIGFRKATLKKS